MDYYATVRKDAIMQFVATWMELEGIMLNVDSQKKNKHSMISLTYFITT